MNTSPLRLGISRCLLGDEVRFDGGHKQDQFLDRCIGPLRGMGASLPRGGGGIGHPA